MRFKQSYGAQLAKVKTTCQRPVNGHRRYQS